MLFYLSLLNLIYVYSLYTISVLLVFLCACGGVVLGVYFNVGVVVGVFECIAVQNEIIRYVSNIQIKCYNAFITFL